jgi:hypothetical protein
VQAIRDEVFGTGAGGGKNLKEVGGGTKTAAAAGGGAEKGKK